MEEFPRKGSALYKMLRGDKETVKKSLSNWKKINKAVIFLYEFGLLPLIGVGRFIVLIYTKGRRSGKTRITPLEYRRLGDSVLLFSARGKRSDWYRNLKMYPSDVKMRIGFKTYSPIIELIEETEALEEILRWYVKKHPQSSKMIFGWDSKRDDPETTDLTSLVNAIKIVKLSF
jgi:deazaflavin-dependent oxidoreductase (nitroreductase family)